ncbi:hypothetical protein NDU88_004342 [Pleurodeles waltl]|uniref:Uncharacterized protein n=1 Tax=Pleurodeles waltl TaxID=8319 RepID=A0AAV7T8V3_PLEWA|nr:hypothetical protein NDU88_004342 [Pleurodeles waltl]
MPCVRPRGKYPGGTSQLVESVQEGPGHCQNAQCWEDAERIRKKEEQFKGGKQREVKERRKHQGTKKHRDKKTKCGQEMVSRWFQRENCDTETVRRGSPEGNRSQETDLR